jgi:hypothetical protein
MFAVNGYCFKFDLYFGKSNTRIAGKEIIFLLAPLYFIMLNCGVNLEDLITSSPAKITYLGYLTICSARENHIGDWPLTFNISVKEFKGVYKYQ